MRAGFSLLGLCAGIGCAGLVHAQEWVPVSVNGLQVSVVTTGVVTYADYKWLMGGCLSVESLGPLTRNGQNFSFNFDIQMETGVACPEDVFFASTNVPLGTLSPGAYTLTTSSWSAPILTNNFTVPLTPPTLHCSGFPSNGCFRIQLSNGVSGMNYVLQCSTDCVNWDCLSTNFNTESLTDLCPMLPGGRFYRVEVLQP